MVVYKFAGLICENKKRLYGGFSYKNGLYSLFPFVKRFNVALPQISLYTWRYFHILNMTACYVSKELRDLVDMIRFVTKLNIRRFLDLDL